MFLLCCCELLLLNETRTHWYILEKMRLNNIETLMLDLKG
jgi:hypothetical protein